MPICINKSKIPSILAQGLKRLNFFTDHIAASVPDTLFEIVTFWMVSMNDNDDKKGTGSRDDGDEKARKIIIEDKRFSRDDEDEVETLETKRETISQDDALFPPKEDSPEVEDKRRSFEVIEEPGIPPAADPTADMPLIEDFPGDGDVFRELTPEDEERLRKAAQAQFEALSKMGIENYLREIFNVAYILSLQYLGLQPNPSNNLTSTDIKRAGVCIDVIDYLRKRLDEFLSTNEKSQLAQLVSELQVIYSKVFTPKVP